MHMRPLVPQDRAGIQLLIKDAFSGHPWYQDHSQDELDKLWLATIAEPGFSGIVTSDDGGAIIGASWWHLPPVSSIHGKTLLSFIQQQRGNKTLIWEDAVLVRRRSQKMGIGFALRNAFIASVKKTYGQVLILTRMRSDNIPSLRLAKRLGFNKTGARFIESQGPHIFQEYWYLLF